jgi:hypothetical protein
VNDGRARDAHACSTPLAEPRLHSHIADGLPADHPLARRRVHCDRCERLLHMQTNRCMRTWIESGRGTHCLRCFIVVAGGFAPDETRLGGADRLSAPFALAPDRPIECSRGERCA